MILTDEGWLDLWSTVGGRLAAERSAGRGHLLTEDVVRYQTVLALDDLGVSPSRLTAEFASPHLNGGKVDLMVDAPSGAAVEFKFPRGSSVGSSPDTMIFGELLKDVIRIPLVGAGDAWVVQVLTARLARYIHGASARLSLTWPFDVGRDGFITNDVIAKLRQTAARSLGGYRFDEAIRLECLCAFPVDAGLSLFAHRVTAVPLPAEAVRAKPTPTPTILASVVTRDGARAEILAVVRALLAIPHTRDVSVPEVIEAMHRRGTGYADSTIRTMMTSHMCAEAKGQGIANYDDLTRTERGRYRLRRVDPPTT